MSSLSDTKGDDWKTLAEDYERLTKETANRPIEAMLARANALLPFAQATGILDNGCGPGPIMARLLRDYEIPKECSLTCSDFSEPMIEQVRKRKNKTMAEDASSPWARVQTKVLNAMELDGVKDSSMSHITAGWVYFMVPEPAKALSESMRVLKNDGVLTCSSWEGSQWIDLMHLLPRVRPDKTVPELPKEWSNVDLMRGQLEKAGFREAEAHRVETSMAFDTREKLVDMLLNVMPPMVKQLQDFSEEERARLRDLMLEEAKKMDSKEPIRLTGTALVAVGRR